MAYHHNNYHNNHNSHNNQGGHGNHHGRSHNGSRGGQYREDRENRESRGGRDGQVINTFTLGTKDLEEKTAEFQYDKGWYSITDIVGEEKNVIYKSKNAQEAYTKWNVYIGRKKERPQRSEKAE